MEILILSCDDYSPTWTSFFHLLEKYYPNHPKAYLSTESLTCPYCQTLNSKGEWTERFRFALERLTDKTVLVLLDDFFIRKPVDVKRIESLEFTNDIIVYNFEKNYREPALHLKQWDIQKNNQVYLNSCQPSVWDREKLIQRLQTPQTPWQWELTKVSSPYIHFINNGDYIIDIGYRHAPFSITKGHLTDELKQFFNNEAIDYHSLLQHFK